MKRILAMATTKSSRVLGFAVSDPYLAYATPLPSMHLDSHIFQKEMPVGKKGVLHKHTAKRGATGHLPEEEILPTNPLQLLERLECTDVGAMLIVKTTPGREEQHDTPDKVDWQHMALENFAHQHYSPILDIAILEYTHTDWKDQVEESAKANPEMWEDIDNDAVDDPSTQAAIALNLFLWKETGGWANTFG